MLDREGGLPRKSERSSSLFRYEIYLKTEDLRTMISIRFPSNRIEFMTETGYELVFLTVMTPSRTKLLSVVHNLNYLHFHLN